MEEQSPSCLKKMIKSVVKNRITYFMALGVLIGLLIGFILRDPLAMLSNREKKFIGFPGSLLIRLLKCAAIPLIFTCIIVAMTSLDLALSRSIGWQFALLCIATKLLSSSVGLTMVLSIHPGRQEETTTDEEIKMVNDRMLMDVFLDLFRNLITENSVRIFVQQYQTKITPKVNDSDDSSSWTVELRYIDSPNLIGIIFTTILMGVTLNLLQEKGKGIVMVASNVYEIAMLLITWVMYCAPVLLIFMIMSEVLRVEDFGIYLRTWGVYVLTMNAGFLVLLLVQYPLLLFILTGVNPFKFYSDISSALMTAFATASSIATMPIVIDCLIRHGVDSRVVRFVVPIGISVNKDGAACAEVVTWIFVAQMMGVSLSWGHYFTIMVMALMGSIIMAAVPFGGTVVTIMVLNTFGFRQTVIAGVLAVEWINDRGATCCNVLGNCSYPKILEKWNKKRLEKVNDHANALEIS